MLVLIAVIEFLRLAREIVALLGSMGS